MNNTSQKFPSSEWSNDTDSNFGGNRIKIGIGIAVVMVAFGYFIFIAFESASLFYYTVSELQQRDPNIANETVRVSGKLVAGSFSREPDNTMAHFQITDGISTMNATHDGVLPDLFFNEHSEIILEGSYNNQQIFISHDVSVKCPSKYIATG